MCEKCEDLKFSLYGNKMLSELDGEIISNLKREIGRLCAERDRLRDENETVAKMLRNNGIPGKSASHCLRTLLNELAKLRSNA